ADAEDQRGDDQVPVDRHHQPPCSSRPAGVTTGRPSSFSSVAAVPGSPCSCGGRTAPTASAIVPLNSERGVIQCAESRISSSRVVPPRRRASTTAPTAATSSSSEATSNGNRNFVSSASPICAGDPKPDTYGAPSPETAFRPEPSTAIASSTNSASIAKPATARSDAPPGVSGRAPPPT